LAAREERAREARWEGREGEDRKAEGEAEEEEDAAAAAAAASRVGGIAGEEAAEEAAVDARPLLPLR
jgi:hypothetical protein